MQYRFLGHGAGGGTLDVGGTVYVAGDAKRDKVTLAEPEKARLERLGLRFEKYDESEAPAAVPVMEPHGDQGEVIDTAGKAAKA